jgi:hypothetical protein
MKRLKKLSLILALLLLLCAFSSCMSSVPPSIPPGGTSSEVEILDGEKLTLQVGETVTLHTTLTGEEMASAVFAVTGYAVTVDRYGVITALTEGVATVTVTYDGASDWVQVTVRENVTPPSDEPPVPDLTEDPYVGVSKTEFYENYTPASSYMDAYFRSQHFLMSGSLTVPDAAPTLASFRPKVGTLFVKNSEMNYEAGGNVYVVVDGYGREVMRLYRGGAYITLEEVAAYLYAFGELPANYTSKKSMKPTSSPWGEYLRCNHSYFSGDTSRYPYEPELPEISGCGGSMQYYEMDIGTTGTDTGGGYAVKIYNDGKTITRGAARIVYTRMDKNRNGTFEEGEIYLFYTYNHYNDFQEYLNYYGGWGEMFGNITGGGTLSSKTDYNPTPYVRVHYGAIAMDARSLFVPWLHKEEYERFAA